MSERHGPNWYRNQLIRAKQTALRIGNSLRRVQSAEDQLATLQHYAMSEQRTGSLCAYLQRHVRYWRRKAGAIHRENKRLRSLVTREDVERIRRMVAAQGPNEPYFGAWTDMADRLAQLLPPKEV